MTTVTKGAANSAFDTDGPISSFPAPGLRPITRHITTHSPSNGSSTFHSSDNGAHHRLIGRGRGIGNIIYSTSHFPLNLNTGDEDVDWAAAHEPAIHVPGGTLARMIDFAPGVESPMHRACSLDYGVVIEGTLELILDSGERRVLERGDMVVNRASSHAWRNVSETEPARALFVLMDIAPLVINGDAVKADMSTLKEDYVRD